MPQANKAAYDQFAVWLQRQHPDVFAQLLAQAQKIQGLGRLYRGRFTGRESSRGLGDYASYIDLSSVASDAAAASPDMLDAITVESAYTGGGSAFDNSLSAAVSADTAGVNLDVSPTVALDAGAPADLQTNIPTMPSASVGSAASSVGSFLSSLATPQVALAALRAATQVITANDTAKVITAQAQRAANGQAPANVSYVPVTDNATGIVSAMPVLNTGQGQMHLSTAGINALAPSTFLQNYGLYIMLGLAALVFATSE
jgi:hypothetical protein